VILVSAPKNGHANKEASLPGGNLLAVHRLLRNRDNRKMRDCDEVVYDPKKSSESHISIWSRGFNATNVLLFAHADWLLLKMN
jgi:hypothetical protein